MKTTNAAILAMGLLVLAACSSYTSNPELNYYHGMTPPETYIVILRASPTEIQFEIRVEFTPKQLYHLVLEGNTPVAEGWYSTLRAGGQTYTVTMKPKKDLLFEVGKTYRLCIGEQNPEEVQLTSSNYRCMVDYVFVMEEKA
jgi:hypothetical protein